MNVFSKKSRWDKLTDALPAVQPKDAVKSGLGVVATFLGVTMASAAVSAVRRRQEQR